MNFKQLFWRKDLLLFCLLGALLLSGCNRSPEARRDKYVARGKQFLAAHDYSRAILELKNAAGAKPKDAEVYYLLGMAYAGVSDWRSALGSFRRALAIDPNQVQAQLKIAEMMAGTDDPALLKEAREKLTALLDGAKPSVEMLNTLAFTNLKLGNTDSAIENLEKALNQSPGELNSASMLAMTKIWQKDLKGAEEVLKKASADAPKSADAHRVLGMFYRDQKRPAEAESEFRRALQLDPKNGVALLNLASLEASQGRQAEAEQDYKRLSGIDTYKSTYALYLFQQGRKADAIREFEKIAKASADDRQARTNLVAAYRSANRVADAEKVLDAALKENPKDADALLQRAELLIIAGKYQDAETRLNSVRSLRPSAPEVHFVLARLNQARGSTLTYQQELGEALRLNPYLQNVRLELAQSLLLTNAAQTALEVLDAAPGAQKDIVPIVVERNWVLWALGDLAEMRKGIDHGMSLGGSADLLVQNGLWKLRSGDPAGARASLADALKIDPADLRALEALKQTYLAQKNNAMALQEVKKYAASQPKSAPVQDFLGSMLMTSGDRTQARAAFEAAKAADPHFVNAELALAQLDTLEGKSAEARKRLEAILAGQSNNATALLWLGNLEDKSGNYQAAIDHFRKALAANPDNAQADNNLAYLLSEYAKQPDEALKYAQKAVELAPGKPAYCDTLGWILYRKGVYSSAVEYLEQANSQVNNAMWKYHLAMAYTKGGRTSQGRLTLEAALKMNPNLPEAKMARDVVGTAQ